MCNRCACFLDSKSIFERKQHGEDDDDVNDDVNDEALSSLVFGRALTDSLSLARARRRRRRRRSFYKVVVCVKVSFQ